MVTVPYPLMAGGETEYNVVAICTVGGRESTRPLATLGVNDEMPYTAMQRSPRNSRQKALLR